MGRKLRSSSANFMPGKNRPPVEGLLNIDKPPGLLTIATEHERERTAYRALWDLLEARRPRARPYIVHRLDRETSGLLVIAKTPVAKQTGPRRGGREAITRYRVRERGPRATLIDIALGTGRRHQIRVQLAAIGHPVVGDTTHGSRRDPLGRVCLHASVLGFVHPATREPVRFESPPPQEFLRLARGV